MLFVEQIYCNIQICGKQAPYQIRYLQICCRMTYFREAYDHFDNKENEQQYPNKCYKIRMKIKKQYGPEEIHCKLNGIKLKASRRYVFCFHINEVRRYSHEYEQNTPYDGEYPCWRRKSRLSEIGICLHFAISYDG